MNSKSVYIIAEAGVNHNGSLDIAKKLIDAAAESGADAVKFQTFQTDKLVSIYAQKAEYQKKHAMIEETQFAMIKKLELDRNSHLELQSYCKQKKICFLSSPFDLESIDLLVEIGLDIFKIPSGEITNLPYLEKIGALKKKVILSTGMSYLIEVKKAIDILIRCGTEIKSIVILHCNSEYPSPFKDVNLNAMVEMKKEFGIEVGYSDHTLGIEVPIAAVALGAVVIEKHFTLDKNMPGPDHAASLDPIELKQMVMSIRNVEKCFGNGIKEPSESEKKNIISGRKSIVACEDIRKGEVFSQINLAVKRPGNGISPMEWYNLLGKVAIKDFNKDELIQL